MPLGKRALCVLTAACLFHAGCYVRLSTRSVPLRTEEERTPISASGPILGEVRSGPGPLMTLLLTRETTEQVQTVEILETVQRRFDLTALAIVTAAVGGLFLILFIALLATSDGGGGGSSHDWDWD